ncbi:MAG: alanine dehydrogenase, partial [Nitrospirota bacterium]
MRIGIPKEIKDREHRVALTPEGARQLVNLGHEVMVEVKAGLDSGFEDEDYGVAGAKMVSAAQAWDTDLVLKVKEPLESEYKFLGTQILFTYLHLSGVPPELTDTLLSAGTTAIAYETVEDNLGRLPLLAPMSGVAGTMAVTVGSNYLARVYGGKGTLLGMVMGKRNGNVLVIGDGIVGRHAARAALALGANVRLAGLFEERIPDLNQALGSDWQFVLSNPENLTQETGHADLIVGAVLVPGAKAPSVVTESMVRAMEHGSVIVDVSIDQGGCVATSRPTSHSNPIYQEHGVIHYCVTNMPGAYPHTSTIALTNATLPYATALADHGIGALRKDAGFAKGVNIRNGAITCRAVAEAFDKLN